jgi:succinyl-diaminopimelate desuccinylase
MTTYTMNARDTQVPSHTRGTVREKFAATLADNSHRIVDLTKSLVNVPSHYPPGDTHAMARCIEQFAADVPGLEIQCVNTLPHVANLVLRVKGAKPGRRLVFNGHMDTFPLVNPNAWTTSPAGEERDGKLYGLGVSDMKGGLAAILFAMSHLTTVRDTLAGEVVATLVGDEESMGMQGTQYLLEHSPLARGDAMISADTGSMQVLRFGEKGMLWLTLHSTGRSAHAAHVHRGECAVEKLTAAMNSLTAIRNTEVDAPFEVATAIDQAAELSESLSGVGESDVLRKVTLTFGTVSGGRLSNLIADAASATVDIRIPVGLTVAAVESRLNDILLDHPGVSVEINRRYEPSWTPPDHEVIRTVTANCEQILKARPVVNMRVGASDARLYRYAQIPSVVCGLTAFNMGGADEHVYINELRALGEVYALTAFDYLF